MSNRLAANVLRVVAILIAAAALQRFVVLPWHANAVLDAVERQTEEAARSIGARQVVLARSNIERLDAVATGARTEVDYYILAAENAKLANDPAEAIRRYTGALTVDHRPEIYFGRALVRMEMHDEDGAIIDFTRAVEFNPDLLRRIGDRPLRNRVREALRH